MTLIDIFCSPRGFSINVCKAKTSKKKCSSVNSCANFPSSVTSE